MFIIENQNIFLHGGLPGVDVSLGAVDVVADSNLASSATVLPPSATVAPPSSPGSRPGKCCMLLSLMCILGSKTLQVHAEKTQLLLISIDWSVDGYLVYGKNRNIFIIQLFPGEN